MLYQWLARLKIVISPWHYNPCISTSCSYKNKEKSKSSPSKKYKRHPCLWVICLLIQEEIYARRRVKLFPNWSKSRIKTLKKGSYLNLDWSAKPQPKSNLVLWLLHCAPTHRYLQSINSFFPILTISSYLTQSPKYQALVWRSSCMYIIRIQNYKHK